MKTRFLYAALALLALALAPALPAAGGGPGSAAATALGKGGQLYELLAGTWGELFPDDATGSADAPVLALDVVQPDGARERILVPGTAGPEVEGTPSLVFEDASQRLFAVWESKTTSTVSRLLLADYIPAGWSEPLEISGDVSPLRDAPRVLVTRDRFTVDNAAGERTSRSRTVIHVVWLEEDADGKGYYYTPVILEGGRYLGWNPVVELAELEPEAPAPKAAAAADPSELLRAPELAAGQDVHSVVLGYLSPASGRLMTVEARLLPGELGFLADELRGHIIEIGVRDREEMASLAARLRGHIIEIGHRLNGGVVRHLAERSHDAFLDTYDEDEDRPLESLADILRGHIIEIGRELLGGPGRTLSSKLLEVPPIVALGSPANAAVPGVTHLVQLQVVMERPTPPLAEVPARLFLSEDGERALVGWLSRGRVFYTETSSEAPADEGAWTAVQHLTLTPKLGAEEASEVLRSRVRSQP